MKSFKKIIVLVFAVLYSIIFWNEKMGINLLFFTSALLMVLYAENKDSFRSNTVKITVAGTLVSGIMVLVFNSFISKFSHIVSFWIMLGFVQQSSLRSVYYSLQYSAINYLKAPKSFLVDLTTGHKSTSKTGLIFYNLRLVFIPFIALFVFYILFYNANPHFAELAGKFWNRFFRLFGNLFEYISFGRILFILAGTFLTCGIVYRSGLTEGSNDALIDDTLNRIRAIRRGRVFDPMNALKKEYKMAVLLVALVNLLLLIVNGIDISWIWINFTVPEGMVLKHFVHEGTYLLILSILLSIGIILYFFRNNLNFYPGNKLLKVLSYIWMGQNMILTISVCLRNYHYINYHGLAYKRIGVIIFLLLTIAGLASMIIKVSKTKSSYYVIKQNLWACYSMLILMSIVNWDMIIARFNLNHWNRSGIDVNFYFTLSPKVIPLLYQSLPAIEEQIKQTNISHTNYTPFTSIREFERELNQNKLNYLREQMGYSWLSWNLSDHRTLKSL